MRLSWIKAGSIGSATVESIAPANRAISRNYLWCCMKDRRTQRSDKAQQYRALYRTSRWQRIRTQQLGVEPLCQRCKREGRITAATVCHHMDKASKENPETFFAGPYMSLCAPCHDGPVQSEEVRGYSKEIGIDGWPTSPDHPTNKAAR